MRNKIKNQKGMSFLMALLFFLTCALAGSTILSMAQAYGRRTVVKPEREAKYLAVRSAVEFVKGQLEECDGFWSFDWWEFDMENELQREILEELRDICEAYQNNPHLAVRKKLLSISLEEDEEGKWELPEVAVKMTLQAEKIAEAEESEETEFLLRVEAVFSLAEEGGDYGMSLTANGTAVYEAEDYMEILWEEMAVEPSRAER